LEAVPPPQLLERLAGFRQPVGGHVDPPHGIGHARVPGAHASGSLQVRHCLVEAVLLAPQQPHPEVRLEVVGVLLELLEILSRRPRVVTVLPQGLGIQSVDGGQLGVQLHRLLQLALRLEAVALPGVLKTHQDVSLRRLSLAEELVDELLARSTSLTSMGAVPSRKAKSRSGPSWPPGGGEIDDLRLSPRRRRQSARRRFAPGCFGSARALLELGNCLAGPIGLVEARARVEAHAGVVGIGERQPVLGDGVLVAAQLHECGAQVGQGVDTARLKMERLVAGSPIVSPAWWGATPFANSSSGSVGRPAPDEARRKRSAIVETTRKTEWATS
jgi:hypothetical protein